MGRGRPKIDLNEQRKKLVASGRVLFVERGYLDTTTDLLASHSVVSKRTVYQHFQDKAHLLKVVLRSQGDRLLPPPHWDEQEEFGEALWRLFLLRGDDGRPRDISDLLLVRAAWDAAPYVPELRDEFNVIRTEISEWLDDLRRAGRFDESDTLAVTTMMMGALFGGLAACEREGGETIDRVRAEAYAYQSLKIFARRVVSD